MTNKCNAERQIAKRVRRLERANLALDRKQLHSCKWQQAVEPEDTSAEGDSDLRYHISASKKTLRTSSAPSSITEATLLSMYVF
jgi:hypothetical protein